MPHTASRLSTFTESVIRGTTRLANQYGAINLAQGFPDFEPPEILLDALERAARGPFHQYAVTWGAPRFREALASKNSRFMGIPIDPDEHLVVTCGSTEAMMVAMMTACAWKVLPSLSVSLNGRDVTSTSTTSSVMTRVP